MGKGGKSKGSFGGFGGFGGVKTEARKGSGKGPSRKVPNQESRNFISRTRVLGIVDEWKATWGWVAPLQQIDHEFADRNRGRVYVHEKDLREGVELPVGAQVEFLVYADGKGLGAADCVDMDKAAADEADANLPKGWAKVWSDEHDEYYYWNKATKEALWEPPAKEGAPKTKKSDDILPDGWEKHYDTAQEEWYFWNRKTKETMWEPPMGSKVSMQLPSEKPGKPRVEQEFHRLRLQGTVTHWQTTAGQIKLTTAVPEEFQDLVAKSEGKIHLSWRDVQPGVKIIKGVTVDFLVREGKACAGLCAMDVRLSDGKRSGVDTKMMAELREEWASMDEEFGIAEGQMLEEAAANEELDDDDGGVLLPGWEQEWSDEHGCNYYWHAKTQTSSWDRPAVPGFAGRSAEEKAKVWEGEGTYSGAAKMATPITPLANKPGRQMTPITPSVGAMRRPAPSMAMGPPGKLPRGRF